MFYSLSPLAVFLALHRFNAEEAKKRDGNAENSVTVQSVNMGSMYATEEQYRLAEMREAIADRERELAEREKEIELKDNEVEWYKEQMFGGQMNVNARVERHDLPQGVFLQPIGGAPGQFRVTMGNANQSGN